MHALLGRQVATRQRDHDSVVAAEQDVDKDDLKYRCPTQRLKKLKHFEPPKAFMKRMAGPGPAALPRAFARQVYLEKHIIVVQLSVSFLAHQ
ncbi:hypothetical protein [Achromobacter animicus]|uniref:hypothetical protein n=1 Tax=Achromobacter animicus TaxID=1389935 RepID=UPI0020C5BE0B|nr:hypothetical protein [Achromobacter animicus]MDH0683174.1 hypothetical protein [Achromobacter animicus]